MNKSVMIRHLVFVSILALACAGRARSDVRGRAKPGYGSSCNESRRKLKQLSIVDSKLKCIEEN